jgi:twitching motility protein PilI
MTPSISEPRIENVDLSVDRNVDRPRSQTQSDPAARRTRMREFQTRLVDRMQAARSSDDSNSGRLGLVIGDAHYLLELRQAGEIIAVGTITSVPLTKPWFLGLANIRGSLIGVVDYAQFQGNTPTVIDRRSRIIAFGPSLGFSSSLLVGRVLGLRNVTDMQPHEGGNVDLSMQAGSVSAPTAVNAEKIECYMDQDKVVWRVLDLAAVMQDPLFLHVGA